MEGFVNMFNNDQTESDQDDRSDVLVIGSTAVSVGSTTRWSYRSFDVLYILVPLCRSEAHLAPPGAATTHAIGGGECLVPAL